VTSQSVLRRRHEADETWFVFLRSSRHLFNPNAEAHLHGRPGQVLVPRNQAHHLLHRGLAQLRAARHFHHLNQSVLRSDGRNHRALVLLPRRGGGARPDANHRGAAVGRPHRARGHEEHDPVLRDEQAARQRRRQAEDPVDAVAYRVHGPRVRCGGEVVEEHGRRADEGAAGLRAPARRARALDLVGAGLVVGDAGPAAVRFVGAGDPVPADDVFEGGVATVGAGTAARVALLGEEGMARAASGMPGLALPKKKKPLADKDMYDLLSTRWICQEVKPGRLEALEEDYRQDNGACPYKSSSSSAGAVASTATSAPSNVTSPSSISCFT
jgi:hypothetical protein